MTTMLDKLVARAMEYEERARYLRLAAAEMNGHALNGKRETAVGTLDAAIALRKAQRNGKGGPKGPQGPRLVSTADREASIRGFLAGQGPQTTAAVRAHLTELGQGCSTSWTLKIMREMKDVRLTGKGNQSRWQLGKGKSTKRGPTRIEARAKRARIAEILDAYDEANPKTPAEVAKSFGLTVSQTGLAPLVHQGYLKKRKGGYIRTAKVYQVDKPSAEA